jgi:hypothetical protein
MKTYWGSGGIAPPFFTFALAGGEWSASCPCRVTLWERAPGTRFIEGRVGRKVGLEAVEKRKILHCWESKPDRTVRSFTNWAIPIHVFRKLLIIYCTDSPLVGITINAFRVNNLQLSLKCGNTHSDNLTYFLTPGLYCPLRTLASFTEDVHCSRLSAFCLLLFTFSSRKSFSISPSYLNLGPPTLLLHLLAYF